MSQGTNRSSKGKARAAEGDYAQCFASLSLSDRDDALTTEDVGNPYGSSYTDVYGSSYEQVYTGGDPYSWTTQSSLATIQSTSGYSGSYSTTPGPAATSSMGGYEYRSQPSNTSNYSGYSGYGAASVPSSYGGGQVSGWSDTPSQSTALSSAPSVHSNRTNVNNTINRQRPPNHRYQLPCEFYNITGCDRVFPGDDEHGWKEHIEGHLQSQFPARLRCWFCSEHQFDARETSAGDVRSNFNTRMQHIRHHIVYEGYGPEQMLGDGHLIRHLLDRNLIDIDTCERIMFPTTWPPMLDRHGRHSTFRPLHRFPQVEEEVLAESSSRRRHGDTAREHTEDQNVSHAGHEHVPGTVVNDLRQIDTGFVGKADGNSSARIEPLVSPDHANFGPSSLPSDTSSPGSGSFSSAEYAEYSEEEDKRLAEDHPFIQAKGLAVAKVLEAFGSWKGNYSEQDTPCDGVDKSDTEANQAKEKGKQSGPSKRTWAEQSDNGENINNEDGPSSNRIGCSKRRRTSDRQLTFACPYTKKDPMSYRDCYKYTLSRIRDVKQHLDRRHRNPPYCPRCMGTFQTEEERDGHIREFSCPSRQPTKLEGITELQRRQLSKKSAPNTSPEAQWFVVFDIVFPGHEPRPQSPYVDRELLQDITHYQDFLTCHGPSIISEVLEQRGIITINCLGNDQMDFAAFQQAVLEEGLGMIFEQYFDRRGSDPQDPGMPGSGSGSNSQDTPQTSSPSSERVSHTSAHDCVAVDPEAISSRPGEEPVVEPPEDETELQILTEKTSSGGDRVLPVSFENWEGNTFARPRPRATYHHSEYRPVTSPRENACYTNDNYTSSHRRLPQVQEEVAAEPSSSRRQYRPDQRREHTGNREHGSSSHKHRHRR